MAAVVQRGACTAVVCQILMYHIRDCLPDLKSRISSQLMDAQVLLSVTPHTRVASACRLPAKKRLVDCRL